MDKEAPKFEEGSLFKGFFEDAEAQSHREDEVYLEIVDKIRTLAFQSRQTLLSELRALEPTPEIKIDGMETNVPGIIVEVSHSRKNEGAFAILLTPEGLVEVPWETENSLVIPSWKHRKETSAQNYIAFAPRAALIIASMKKDGASSQPKELTISLFRGHY